MDVAVKELQTHLQADSTEDLSNLQSQGGHQLLVSALQYPTKCEI